MMLWFLLQSASVAGTMIYGVEALVQKGAGRRRSARMAVGAAVAAYLLTFYRMAIIGTG